MHCECIKSNEKTTDHCWNAGVPLLQFLQIRYAYCTRIPIVDEENLRMCTR